jgi:hypothetical protein
MRFLSPLSLLWLIPLLGGIIALYLLRKRRREIVVPSLFLWEKILQSVQADTPFQRLRPTLLLFLQLLTAFLLVMAFARPYLLGNGLAGATYVLVIDQGARMNATDVPPSRLAEAKTEALSFVRQMTSRDRAMVIAAGAQPELISALTGDRAQLEKAITEVTGTDEATDLPAAMVLAHALLGRKTGGARIELFSDGGWSEEEEEHVRSAATGIPIHLVPIATAQPSNTGIIAIDARRDLDDPTKGYQIFVSIRNFGASPIQTGHVALLFAGKQVATRPLNMSGQGGTQTEVFESPSFASGGVVTASLEGLREDKLASDNVSSVVIPPKRVRTLLLVTEGDLYLEKGLNLDPDIALYEVAPKDFATIGRSGVGFDLVVFDDFLPEQLPVGRYLVFHALNSQMPVLGAGADSVSPEIVDWNRTDPVMRFVDLSDLKLRSAATASEASWGTTLAEADSGPVIVSGENAGSRIIWVGFTPPDSNFGLNISFPIFLVNAVDWLTEDRSVPVGSNHPGDAIALPHGGDWTIIQPDAMRVSCSCSESPAAACSYTGASHTGLYTAVSGQDRQVYAVDLNDATLSNLAPRGGQNGEPAAAASPSATNSTPLIRDIWSWVAVCALALLTLEWFAYHRRL